MGRMHSRELVRALVLAGPAGFAQLRGWPELLDVYASVKDPATVARLVGAHRAGARQAAADLTGVDTALVGPAMLGQDSLTACAVLSAESGLVVGTSIAKAGVS